MIVTVKYCTVECLGAGAAVVSGLFELNYFFPGTFRSTSQSHKCSRCVVFSRTFVCKNCWIYSCTVSDLRVTVRVNFTVWPPRTVHRPHFKQITRKGNRLLYYTEAYTYIPRIRSELSEWLIDLIGLTKPSCASESESILCALHSPTSCCVVLCCVVCGRQRPHNLQYRGHASACSFTGSGEQCGGEALSTRPVAARRPLISARARRNRALCCCAPRFQVWRRLPATNASRLMRATHSRNSIISLCSVHCTLYSVLLYRRL